MGDARNARHIVLPRWRLLAVAYEGRFDESGLLEIARVIWRDPRWSRDLDAIFDARSANLDVDASALARLASAAVEAGRGLRGELIDLVGGSATPLLAPTLADPDARHRSAAGLDDALGQLFGDRAPRVRSELESLRWAITLPFPA